MTGAPIRVEELTREDDSSVALFLDEIAKQSRSVLAYHYPFYRDMLVALGVGRPCYLGAFQAGELVGILPVFCRESVDGVVYSSLPFFGPNAGVLCGDGPSGEEIHTALLGSLLDRVKREKALSCSLYTPLLFNEFTWYDGFHPDVVVPRTTLYTDLSSVDWNSSIRYDLRRAQRLGLAVSREVTPERLTSFYAIYRQNCSDRGIPPKPKECLEVLVRPEIIDRRVRVYFALQGDEVVAGLLTVFSPATASYYVPCSRDDARTSQPGTVLADTAITDLRASGVRLWNWEGSPSRESGVYRFKKKWNSVESSYRVYIWCPCGTEPLRRLGKDRLRVSFPEYFVYPYDQL